MMMMIMIIYFVRYVSRFDSRLEHEIYVERWSVGRHSTSGCPARPCALPDHIRSPHNWPAVKGHSQPAQYSAVCCDTSNNWGYWDYS